MNNPQSSVLVVEDEKSVQQPLCEKLTGEGFTVYSAYDGKEGLKLALEKPPDVILLDILMPQLDGLTMLKELRKDPWGLIAIVIIFSNVDPDKRILAEVV